MDKPTPGQVATVLAHFRDIAPKIRQVSAFGESNRERIDAQIAVLAGERSAAWYYQDETAEEFEDGDNNCYYAAEDAENWLKGEYDEPAAPFETNWDGLLPKEEPT